jgi:hypothetical protein
VLLIRDGKAVALGISFATRFLTLPDVPPSAEARVTGFDAVAWLMLVARTHTATLVVENFIPERRPLSRVPRSSDS